MGWKIDIFTESRHQELHAIGRGLEQLAAVAEIPLEDFTEAGYNSLNIIAAASDEDLLSAVAGLSAAKLSDLRTAANFLGAQVSRVEEDAETEVEVAPENLPEAEEAASETDPAPADIEADKEAQ